MGVFLKGNVKQQLNTSFELIDFGLTMAIALGVNSCRKKTA
jgi:hypothetical protein